MSKPALLAGLVLAASVLTGCGGGDAGTSASDTTTYCHQLKADKKYVAGFSRGEVDAGQIGEAINRFHDLADAAPADIAPQWDLLDGTLSKIELALSEAGISTKDLAGLQSGKIPKGVDMSKLGGLMSKAKELNSPELRAALKKIETHAKDTCGVDVNKR